MLNEKPSALHSTHTHAPIKFSYRFLQSLFGIEKSFDSGETFHVRSGRSRLMNHLTKADLQLAMTLQVGIQTDGISTYINRHIIYVKLTEIFETPVNKDQFYAAYQKFILHKLIVETKEKHIGTRSISLPSYLEPDGQLGRFVILPSLVTGKVFATLPIANQKLYLYACGQQGDERRKVLQLNFSKLGELIHREDNSHIRKVLEQLGSTTVQDGQALFSIARVERNLFGEPKAVFQVNAALSPRHLKGLHYRSIFPAKKSYRRLMAQLKGYLLAMGCDSFLEGDGLLQLAAMLKDKSESVKKYVMARIKESFNTEGENPERALNRIRLELQDKGAAALLAIAKDTGVLRFVKDYNRYDFIQKLQGFVKPGFRKLCRRALITLNQTYTLPGAFTTLDYKKSTVVVDELEKVIDIEWFRRIALTKRLDPTAFRDMITDASYKWQQGQAIEAIMKWIAWEMDKLPYWEPIPDPPQDFCLAGFLKTV
ncbi:hypothetical protein [Paenibacillus sinopodophylli]|uniref:hypothetical protein n=1 Tax=Paenibacillus sinopodophylli TaxID=1837342 RepID=UPI00110CE215|nr:hypothetical protein [Paenibacillus sinopodophylli]